MNSKISIIIPFYNTKIEYLKEAIESAINQTYNNIEIIVVNDGSLSMYDSFLKTYEGKIKVIKTDNKGVSSARNTGIKASTGEYITFLDSDDFLEKDACLKFIEFMNDNKDCDIVISRVNVHDKDKCYQNYCSNNENHQILNKEDLIESIFINEGNKYTCVDTPWAKLYKRNFLVENNITFNENLTNGEDGLFNFIAYYKSNKIYFTKEITYNYRINPYSTCKTYSEDLNIRFSKLLTAYKELFEKENIYTYDKMLSLFALRIFCRLIRKYYSYCNTYQEFKEKYSNNNGIYEELLGELSIKECDNKKAIVLTLYKLKMDYLIYLLSKSNVKIK